jgi:hypothetical protein
MLDGEMTAVVTPPQSETGTGAGTSGALAAQGVCERCGGAIVRRRVRAAHDHSLCLRCEQKARAAAYFRSYYASNKDRILDKNRRWAKDNASALAERRRVRAAQRPAEARQCVDCGAAVARAERCRRCHVRHRYATDPDFRAQRLAITQRWLTRRTADSTG